MDITNGIKINDSILNNNNMFKFVTVIDFNCEENAFYLPLRITEDNENEFRVRYRRLTKNKTANTELIIDIYQQIFPQLPSDTNSWEDGKVDGKTELIVWVKLDLGWFFEKKPVDNYNNNFVYKRFITEEILNYIINFLYFYDNIGIGEQENNTYYPVDDEEFNKGLTDFQGILHKNFLYFVRPFGTDRFSSFEFTQPARYMAKIKTKPIMHTYFPAKTDKSNLKSIRAKFYEDTFRLYVYDTSSSSISSTENYTPPNINLSYLPVINTYNYGAINYFNPNIDYATSVKDFITASGTHNPSNIKGDLVTKREVLKNKLRIFNSQELSMRIAGAVSLSGRLQWLSKGYKYQDDNRYSTVEYNVVSETLNYDKTVYKKLSSETQSFLRISNINFDLFKSAMPVQIHTPPARSQTIWYSYNSGFPNNHRFAPPIYFRIKDAHTLDVVFEGIDSSIFRQPYGLTTSASHIFFIDVSIIDDIFANPENVFKGKLPYHIQHIIAKP